MASHKAARTAGWSGRDLRGRHTLAFLMGAVAGIAAIGLVLPVAVGGSVAGGAAGHSATGGEGRPDGDPSRSTDGGRSVAGAATGSRGMTTGAESNGAHPGGHATATGVLGASDLGVTATEVLVGIPIIDTGPIAQMGVALPGLDPQQQRETWRAFLDDLNGRGGVLGRTVKYFFRTNNILVEDDKRATCVYFTQDLNVFAVLDGGGYHGPSILCVTKENETVLVAGGSLGIPKGFFTQSAGRLTTVQQAGPRLMRNFAFELGRLGRLQGKRFGLLSGGELQQVGKTYDILVDAMRKVGGEVAFERQLSEDLATSASQIPLAVQEMRTRGVDSVLLMTNIINATNFVATAGEQRYYPDYYTTDWQLGGTDTYAADMPDSFDGALAISSLRHGDYHVGLPEPDADRACRLVFEERTGKRLSRGNNQYWSAVETCNIVRIFESAASGAGPELTREAFSRAVQGLGRMALADFGDGAFGLGKFDAIDHVRTLRWYADCACWKPLDGYRRVQDRSPSDS